MNWSTGTAFFMNAPLIHHICLKYMNEIFIITYRIIQKIKSLAY